MSFQLQKLKARRWLNRRSNSAVEQLEKILIRLSDWIKRLDDEQDEANKAMQAELEAIRVAGEQEFETMRKQLSNREREIKEEAARTEEDYVIIIRESKSEAEKARKVHANFQALTK